MLLTINGSIKKTHSLFVCWTILACVLLLLLCVCRQEVVQLLAETCLCRLDLDSVDTCIHPVYEQLIVSHTHTHMQLIVSHL